jgi:hypothetical protein
MNDPYSTPRPALDLVAWAEYEAGNLYARLAYDHEHTPPTGIDYKARTAASEKQRRYQARKKETR